MTTVALMTEDELKEARDQIAMADGIVEDYYSTEFAISGALAKAERLLDHFNALTAQLQQARGERDKWKRRAKAFQEGYKDKSSEAFALEIQKMDLLAHGADKVGLKQNESLRTKLLATSIERNQLRTQLATAEAERDRLLAEIKQPRCNDCNAELSDNWCAKCASRTFRSQLVTVIERIAQDSDKAAQSGAGDPDYMAGKRDAARYVIDFIEQFQFASMTVSERIHKLKTQRDEINALLEVLFQQYGQELDDAMELEGLSGSGEYDRCPLCESKTMEPDGKKFNVLHCSRCDWKLGITVKERE